MSPSFTALTLALAALQDTGVPKTPLQLEAIASLRAAIQEAKTEPQQVPLQAVLDFLEMHHNLAEGRHNYYQHAIVMLKMAFPKSAV